MEIFFLDVAEVCDLVVGVVRSQSHSVDYLCVVSICLSD